MTFLLIGGGISNLTLSRILAEHGHSVSIIERKNHIGGNCFDYFDENSVDIHAYGTHIFHTDDAEYGDSSPNLLSGILINMK